MTRVDLISRFRFVLLLSRDFKFGSQVGRIEPQISIIGTKEFWGIIFNLIPLNGHYLYTPVFPNTRANEGKTPQKELKNSVPHFSGIKHFKTLKPIYFTIEKIY